MSLTQASDTDKMQVKITSDKQSKNGTKSDRMAKTKIAKKVPKGRAPSAQGQLASNLVLHNKKKQQQQKSRVKKVSWRDEQMEGMSVSEDASLHKFSDPAILFVREVIKIQYTKAELIKLRDAPLSKRKPDFFDSSEVSPAILDPERWNFDRKKSESSGGEGGLRSGAGPDSATPTEPRRRAVASGDPRERVRKENDGIVLSPQRRSFNTGCFVPASSGAAGGGGGGGAGGRSNRSHSPLGGKNDGPHLGIREIQPNTRRIGSGRILRDTWDFGDKPESNGGDGQEYGFRGGQQQHRGNGDDKYDQRRIFDRDFGGKERDGGGGGGGRRNGRYDRRRISDHREQEEPEWFSGGPTSQNDTIELRGFDEGKKKLSPSRVRRAKEWSKKKTEATQRQPATEEKEEPKEAPRQSTPSPQDGKLAGQSPPKPEVAERKAEENAGENTQAEVKMDVAEEGFNLDDFLKCDTIPGLLTNGVGADEDNTKSRFSRWFNKQESPEKTSSRRSSLHDDHPSIIKDLLEDIGGDAVVPMPGDSEAYFAPISPAANTGSVIGAKRSNQPQQHQHQSQPLNIMEMLQKVGRGQAEGSKQAPPAGKILSLDELESKMRHNVEMPAPKHQPQKPDEEMAAAFKKLLAQAQAGVHPVTSSGPMNKQPMSLLEMLNHSQQQDEAARLNGGRAGPPQQPLGGDLAMKLQQAQQLQHQKQQMEMLNKLINATASSPMHAQQQMRGSPLQDLGLQQSRELLNRPEAQAILQGLKRGEITTQHLYQQLANPALQPRHREMLATVLKTQGGGYGPSPGALSPQLPPPPHHVYQQQLSLSPLPSVNAMHQRIPSPRELQVHTQNILQRALIKKKLEEQQENYRKKQEMQRGQSPGANSGSHGQPKNTPASPTPLAFTPTSVLRKMTADKEEGKENKGVPLGRALTGVRPQPVQPQGQQWNPQFPSMKHQAGRPIVKANNHYQTQTPEQFFSQHQAQQQQQRMFNQPPPGISSSSQQQQQQQRSNKAGSQFASMGGQGQGSQAQYNPPQYSTNQQFNPQQLRAQHQHRPSNQPAQTQAQPAQRAQQMAFQQQNVGGAAWQQFFGSAQPGPRSSSSATSASTVQPSDRLSSPTADQLSRWFSPDLLERARGGELPSTANLMAQRGAASLEEIERQAAAAPVRN